MDPCDSHPITFLGLLLQSKFSSCNSRENSELLRDFVSREFNAFLWVALIVITTLLVKEVYNLFRLWHKAKKIPGPQCSSFFGHCKLLSRENLTGNFVYYEFVRCWIWGLIFIWGLCKYISENMIHFRCLHQFNCCILRISYRLGVVWYAVLVAVVYEIFLLEWPTIRLSDVPFCCGN